MAVAPEPERHCDRLGLDFTAMASSRVAQRERVGERSGSVERLSSAGADRPVRSPSSVDTMEAAASASLEHQGRRRLRALWSCRSLLRRKSLADSPGIFLASLALFGLTMIPDVLDARGVIHLPEWFTMGGIDDARAILSTMLSCVSTVLALIFSVALLGALDGGHAVRSPPPLSIPPGLGDTSHDRAFHGHFYLPVVWFFW